MYVVKGNGVPCFPTNHSILDVSLSLRSRPRPIDPLYYIITLRGGS